MPVLAPVSLTEQDFALNRDLAQETSTTKRSLTLGETRRTLDSGDGHMERYGQ